MEGQQLEADETVLSVVFSLATRDDPRGAARWLLLTASAVCKLWHRAARLPRAWDNAVLRAPPQPREIAALAERIACGAHPARFCATLVAAPHRNNAEPIPSVEWIEAVERLALAMPLLRAMDLAGPSQTLFHTLAGRGVFDPAGRPFANVEHLRLRCYPLAAPDGPDRDSPVPWGRFPKLRSVGDASPEVVVSLSRGPVRDLQSLSTESLMFAAGADLSNAFRGLRSLRVAAAQHVALLVRLLEVCAGSLESLEVAEVLTVGGSELASVLSRLPRLRDLRLRLAGPSTEMLPQPMPPLRRLDIVDCNPKSVCQMVLDCAATLQHLRVHYTSDIAWAFRKNQQGFLAAINCVHELRSLDLGRLPVGRCLGAVGIHRHLEELAFFGEQLPSLDEILEQFPHVQRITLSSTRPSGHQLQWGTEGRTFPEVAYLKLTGFTVLASDLATASECFPNLRHLFVECIRAGDSAAAAQVLCDADRFRMLCSLFVSVLPPAAPLLLEEAGPFGWLSALFRASHSSTPASPLCVWWRPDTAALTRIRETHSLSDESRWITGYRAHQAAAVVP
eukprot:m51a1_g12320 hypothetical protein (563) ;mRNA; f:419420-421108